MGKKITIAVVAAELGLNGISTVIMNYCRYIDKDSFKVTIFSGPPIDSSYIQECSQLGIDIVILPARKPTTGKYYLKLFNSLSGKKYDIVHVHGNSSIISIDLLIAWVKGIKRRLAHCHNTSCTSKAAHKLLKPLFNLVYTKGLACSSQAGEWLFDNRKYDVLPNGFDITRFTFNKKWRQEIREECGIDDGIIIGHIGRFNAQKNQEFLLNLFTDLLKEEENIWLLFVGGGPDFIKFTSYVEHHPNRERIILYGETLSPEKIYSAIDIFALPSRFEGFPMVIVEAQVSGLPCIASTAVPQEVVINDRVLFLPISEEDTKTWVRNIIKVIRTDMEYDRGSVDLSRAHQLDIKCNIKQLENCYKEMMST